MTLRTGPIVLLLALAGTSGCTFDATRLTSTSLAPQPESPPVEAAQAVVEVYADPAASPEDAEWMHRSVQAFANDLRETGLFKNVLLGRGHPEAALGFAVRRDWGINRCGTPRASSELTLGLWHGSTSYRHLYDFTVVAPGGRRIDIRKEYGGRTLSGLLALGLRASRSWSAPSKTKGSTPVVVDAFRSDLLAETALWALLQEQSTAARPARQ